MFTVLANNILIILASKSIYNLASRTPRLLCNFQGSGNDVFSQLLVNIHSIKDRNLIKNLAGRVQCFFLLTKTITKIFVNDNISFSLTKSKTKTSMKLKR